MDCLTVDRAATVVIYLLCDWPSAGEAYQPPAKWRERGCTRTRLTALQQGVAANEWNEVNKYATRNQRIQRRLLSPTAFIAYRELRHSWRGSFLLPGVYHETEIAAPPTPNGVLIKSRDWPIETREWDFPGINIPTLILRGKKWALAKG